MDRRLDFLVSKSIRSLILFALSGAVLGFVVSCTESSSPDAELKPTELVLSAMSDTLLSVTVGAAVLDLPTVVTRDLKGNAASGVVVNFQIIGSDLTSSLVTRISNANGVAKLPEWRVAYLPGVNVVKASIAPGNAVEFRAIAKAGAPAFILKLKGDAQAITAGDELPVSPEVRVTDAFHNSVPSVFVSFAIVAGDGTLSSPGAFTDASGAARAGKWTLVGRGDHALRATVPGLAPVLFTASAFKHDLPACLIRDNVLEGQSIQSELDSTSCVRDEAVAYASLSLARLQLAEYLFRVHSSDFDTNLELVDTLGRVIATNNNASGSTTDSEIRALVPPGGATLVVSAARAGGRGKYVVTYQQAFDPNGCKAVFVTRGLATTRQIREWCAQGGAGGGHTYKIFLKAGEKVTVIVEDLAYSDWSVSFYDPRDSDVPVPNKTPAGYYFTYELTGTIEGYYTFVVEGYPISDYNLTIK